MLKGDSRKRPAKPHAKKRDKPRGIPRGFRRDRDCRTCKLRGVKCDLNRPCCQPCVQSGITCGGYQLRVVWATQATPGRATSSTEQPRMIPPNHNPVTPQPDHALTVPLAPYESRVIQTTAARRGYPNIQTESLIKRLVIFCHQNRSKEGLRQANGYHFSTDGARLMSHVCDFMQTRTQGLSGATCADVGIPESIAAVRYHLAALVDLNKTLEKADPIAILGIAAFAFFEVCDGAFGEWQRHLHGARSLLDCHCRTRVELERLSHDIAGLKEIIAHLVWYDTMGAIIRETTGLIFEDWHREILSEEFFTMVGCPGETFGLLVSIARGDVNTGALGICLQGMEQVLRIEPNSPESTESSASAVAFRCTAIVALLSRVDDDSVTRIREATIITAVDRLCQAIMSVPSTSKFYVHLAAAVYLAGIHATTRYQCDIVRRYWQCCHAADFPRYIDAYSRCETKWRQEGIDVETALRQ